MKIKNLNKCQSILDINDRLKELRKNIVTESNGLLENAGESNEDYSIYVDWNWINRIEIRLDSEIKNIIIEIWVADVKHQWKDLSKISNMKFLENQHEKIKILECEADKKIGAYIKLGDNFGNTLKVANIDSMFVKEKFNKSTYNNFYNTIGGQWKLDTSQEDYIRGKYKLVEQLGKIKLIEKDKEELLNYVNEEIKKQTRKALNLSLGTTVKVYIPLNELKEKDINYSKENSIDELAVQFLKIIKYCKKEIEK